MTTSPSGIHHRHRDYYSENSPIPSIQRFFKKGLSEVIAKRNSIDSDSEQEDADHLAGVGGQPSDQLDGQTARADQGQGDQNRSKKKRFSDLFSSSSSQAKDIQSQDSNRADASDDDSNAEEAYQHPDKADKAYKRSRRPRNVRDPVTGRNTWVHDVGKREYRQTLARAEAGDKRGSQEVLRSNLDSNVTSTAFPPSPPLPSSVHRIDPRLVLLFGFWSLLTVLRLVPGWISVLLNAWLLWFGWRVFLSQSEDQRWDRERRRGEKARLFDESEDTEGDLAASRGITEGAEWFNGILEALWSVMNPELFSSLGGTLEDVMQASIPSFIHSVKVEDLAQGSTPIRITGLRILSDAHAGSLASDMRREKGRRRTKHDRTDDQPAQDEHEQQKAENKTGDDDTDDRGEYYVNLELGFVYRARPTSHGVGGKSRNAHLLIKFWIGARKLLMLPLPVWVEIKGFVGKVRARVQLTSDPPFIKHVTFTFCGLPRVGIEVVPLRINTANIPFISSFIESSIDAAVGEFVMPSSLTLDVGEMLMGDNIKREVLTVGVVVVRIHSATDLEKQDVRGSSDPYCTLSLAKVGKILYSTRVVLNELSPRWEERHVILVTREHLDSDDKVSIALWDSDRFSQDDMLGRAEVDLVALARHPNKLFGRSDTLNGLDRERTKQGNIHWSLGFFTKAPSMRDGSPPNSVQRKESIDDEAEHDGGEMEDRSIETSSPLSQDVVDREKNTQTRNQTTAVDFEPPDPSLPSGILSMQIHHIANLEVADGHTSMRSRKKDEPGQDVENVETEDDPDRAPSAYCRIILNDEVIFQTRTKALNANPFYNAGTERFVRDWRRTLIMVVVYDFRVREADAILGVVPIKLSDLFKESSQVTRFFPLAGGVGHGRIRLSLLFRPVERTSREPKRLGWNIGTVRLLSSPVATDFDESKGASGHDLHLVALRAATLAGSAKIAASRARYVDRGSKAAVEWRLDDRELPFKVPARRRYSAPYVIEFRALSALGKRKTTHMCIVWQQDLCDDEVVDVQLPIWRPKPGHDFHRLRQNYHDYRNEGETEQLGVERIGYLHVKMQFKSGLGKIHTQFDNNPGAKSVMDAWRCCVALGLRSVSGDFANSRTNTAGYLEDMDEAEHVEPGEGSDDSDTSDEDERAAETRRKEGSLGDSEDQEDAEDAGENEGAGLQRSRSLKQKYSDWKAEKEELHRQHKGIKQFKPVRTVSWLGQTAKSAGAGLKDRFDLQDRRSQHVETEL
ncbi:hypothetical protein PHSY_005193 [Pseudozyma hubeiensis SY62]|uniref:C2 domain-containing protein n=1 Tax=Pseudozyma hubeiensis (strain SY62) TaxID=1305764 RepID=R9P8M0_PSEHS|nr:hypothetical protein PHSY_005193 [Pseudozyma hubeiensis SY62]GAC97607.1 hypothetical protein PHSY_005193 [Pseudozyma hubeiensis SY62]